MRKSNDPIYKVECLKHLFIIYTINYFTKSKEYKISDSEYSLYFSSSLTP